MELYTGPIVIPYTREITVHAPVVDGFVNVVNVPLQEIALQALENDNEESSWYLEQLD